MVALEGIENILKVGKAKTTHDQFGGRNQFAEYMEKTGSVDILEKLQSEVSIPVEVYEKAAALVEDYFPVTLVHFMRWINNAPEHQQLRVRERKGFEWMLSMEQPIKLLLSGYGRFHCEFEQDIPTDVLSMCMRSVSGSILDLNQKESDAAS